MASTRAKNIPAKKRGRPTGSRNSITRSRGTAKPKPTTRTAPRKQLPRDESEDELSRVEENHARASRTRKRKADDRADDIAEDQPTSRKSYVQLEPRTKRIPQEQIDTWPRVSTEVHEQIVAVIRDAKNDIANTQRDERRVIAAHNALNPLVRKLGRQLAEAHIPPQAKDLHFNIDKLTERNVHVSRDVTTARHSKQLLTKQVKIAQHLLRKDEESLEQLKKDAKKWRTQWKHREKHGRLHPLLLDHKDPEMDGDSPDDISLQRSEHIDLSLLDAPDADLAPVLEQLRRSLENMQGNHAQVEGIAEAMVNAHAALDHVMYRHATAQQYATL